jgi:hypothetical protein
MSILMVIVLAACDAPTDFDADEYMPHEVAQCYKLYKRCVADESYTSLNECLRKEYVSE